MVYEWDQHKDVLFNLYIQERKPLEEIMQYMKESLNFSPSKRAFQTQFKRWDFPSKQNPAHKNAELVARVKELWETNYSQRSMLETLNAEGFEIKERELMRVRAKNRWLLRVPNGMKANIDEMQEQSENMSQEAFDAFQQGLLEVAGLPAASPIKRTHPPPLAPEVVRKRKERHDEMLQESDARWAAKKRRRRTKGWAGLPADPPGPPRFPSETTLEESKTFLQLSNEKYHEARDQFQKICEEAGVIKKTVSGPEKWGAVKDQLVNENPDLQQVFWNDTTHTTEAKSLALDVICTDVTKRMRTMERRMTIADAKNALGINPEQSRQIRTAFYNTLKTDHFTSKLAAGDEHWQELKEQWISSQPLLRQILASGEGDPQYKAKQKAIEVLCRDVMKRLRDDHSQRGTRHPLADDDGDTEPKLADEKSDKPAESRPTAAEQAENTRALAAASMANSSLELSDLQIDPSLLQAAGEEFPTPFVEIPAALTAIYVRPHPKSQVHANEKMWLGTLMTRTMKELQDLITSKWSDSIVARIDGVEKAADPKQEMKYLIEEDEELDAYLTHVQDRKAVFVVLLQKK